MLRAVNLFFALMLLVGATLPAYSFAFESACESSRLAHCEGSNQEQEETAGSTHCLDHACCHAPAFLPKISQALEGTWVSDDNRWPASFYSLPSAFLEGPSRPPEA